MFPVKGAFMQRTLRCVSAAGVSQRWCFPLGGDLRKYSCIRVNDALLFRVLIEHLVENLKNLSVCF